MCYDTRWDTRIAYDVNKRLIQRMNDDPEHVPVKDRYTTLFIALMGIVLKI